MDQEDIPAGTLVMLSSGEYSDYYPQGFARALKELKCRDLVAAYISEHPEQAADYHFSSDKFIAWMVLRGDIEMIDHTEWHLGSYSCPPHY